jgi:hypothetical protein
MFLFGCAFVYLFIVARNLNVLKFLTRNKESQSTNLHAHLNMYVL